MNQSQCVQWIIHTHLHTHNNTHTHTYIHTYIHASIHPYIHTYIHTYIRTCIHTYIHTYMHACIHACIPTYIPAQSLVRRTHHSLTHTSRVSSFHTHLPQQPLQGNAVAVLKSLLARESAFHISPSHSYLTKSMISPRQDSFKNATTPKSTQSRNSNSLLQIQIQLYIYIYIYKIWLSICTARYQGNSVYGFGGFLECINFRGNCYTRISLDLSPQISCSHSSLYWYPSV